MTSLQGFNDLTLFLNDPGEAERAMGPRMAEQLELAPD